MSLVEVGDLYGLTDKAVWAALKSRDMVEHIIAGERRGRKTGWRKKK